MCVESKLLNMLFCALLSKNVLRSSCYTDLRAVSLVLHTLPTDSATLKLVKRLVYDLQSVHCVLRLVSDVFDLVEGVPNTRTVIIATDFTGIKAFSLLP